MAKTTKSKSKTISLDAVVAALQAQQKDVDNFNRGVNAPGARIRKAAQVAIAALKQVRKDVIEIKNARK